MTGKFWDLETLLELDAWELLEFLYKIGSCIFSLRPRPAPSKHCLTQTSLYRFLLTRHGQSFQLLVPWHPGERRVPGIQLQLLCKTGFGPDEEKVEVSFYSHDTSLVANTQPFTASLLLCPLFLLPIFTPHPPPK